MAGSDSYARTEDLHRPIETSLPGDWAHLAVVYAADNSITLYRNGAPCAPPYKPGSPLQTFRAGEAHVLFGKRHTGGGKALLHGDIAAAALYDRALSATEVAAVFRCSPLAVSPGELELSLSEAERNECAQLRGDLVKLQCQLDARMPLPKAYIGQRQQPAPTHRLKRGDVRSPLEVVNPGGLSAITALDSDLGTSADSPEAQRRLRFAQWVTDPRNPLPARVLVNRLWQYHFGQGIVATPNDFGSAGTGPSHPELLDWLAGELIRQHWSVKALQRLIVCSASYRQSPTSAPARDGSMPTTNCSGAIHRAGSRPKRFATRCSP